ncbi:MAG TPA: DUF2934 domain-containing protein [Terriglobales bacterium]|nr:DUF2934 domain-containing protein [Terriglobales bacterium]
MTSRIPSTTSAAMEPKTPSLNLEDEIRRRAYELYEQRGGEHGHDVEDWLRAEEEIKEMQAQSAAVRTTDRSAIPRARQVLPISVGAFAAST